MTATHWSLALALVAALATMLGGAVVVSREPRLRELPFIIAFGAGFMLAAAFIKMMPESIRLIPSAPGWMLAGYVLAHLFEHTFTSHFHFGEETHTESMLSPGVSVSALVGLVLHAAFDGISISSGFMVSSPLGFFVAIAVILHKVPEGVTMASVMVASGRPPKQAFLSTVVLAAATVVGAFLMFGLTAYRGQALALSAGIATYVAATDLIPELNKLHEMRYSLSAALGVLFFIGIDLLLAGVGVR